MTVHPIMVALRRERERQQLSTQQIAERTGYHPQTIRKAEIGENNPTLSLVEDYANALGWGLAMIARRGDTLAFVPERMVRGEGLCQGCGKSYQVRRDGQIRRHACKAKEKR